MIEPEPGGVEEDLGHRLFWKSVLKENASRTVLMAVRRQPESIASGEEVDWGRFQWAGGPITTERSGYVLIF